MRSPEDEGERGLAPSTRGEVAPTCVFDVGGRRGNGSNVGPGFTGPPTFVLASPRTVFPPVRVLLGDPVLLAPRCVGVGPRIPTSAALPGISTLPCQNSPDVQSALHKRIADSRIVG